MDPELSLCWDEAVALGFEPVEPSAVADERWERRSDGVRAEGRRAPVGGSRWTVTVPWAHSLNLGLRATSETHAEDGPQPPHAVPGVLPAPWQVRAFEVDAVRELLSIVATSLTAHGPTTLTDAGVHRSFDQRPDLRCLAELSALAADVSAARPLVTAAWEVPVREALRGLAARGFDVDEVDLFAERADLRIHYDLDPTGPCTTIVLSTAPFEGIGWVWHRDHAVALLELKGAVATGDPTFDERFVVVGAVGARLRDPALRRRLLALPDATWEVGLHGWGVSVELRGALDRAALDRALAAAEGLREPLLAPLPRSVGRNWAWWALVGQ
jgi:hypothetical protein